jgi:hypothetical protein
MSLKFKAKVLAGMAALAVAGGTAALTGTAAQAATQHCGIYCTTMASQSYGTGHVVATTGTGGTLLSSGANPDEDFVPLAVGSVAQLAQAGEIPSSLASAYANEVVYEFSSAPYGALTSECLGVSSPTAGAHVVLQQCGAPLTHQPAPSWEKQQGTLWIGVHRDASGDYEPFVNVEASKSAALVLTASSASGPLTINWMSLSSGYSGTTVASDQMWESLIGIYGKAQPWPTPTGDEPPYGGGR